MLVLFCCLLTSFNACTVVSNGGTETTASADNLLSYSISYESDKCFLHFSDTFKSSIGDADAVLGRIEAWHLKFNSVGEMKEYIEGGKISANDLLRFYLENGKSDLLEICNLSTLDDARYPSDLTLRYVTFWGTDYSFELLGEEQSGAVNCIDRDEYGRLYNTEFVDFLLDDHVVLSNEMITDRNARVVRYKTSRAELMSVIYQIDTLNGSMYVVECLSSFGLQWYTGPETP